MTSSIVPLLFIAVIIIFLIYFGALANRIPKLWFLGLPLFLLGLGITMSTLNKSDVIDQAMAALIGLPFIIGYFGQKFMGNATFVARLFGSTLGAGGVAIVTSVLGLGSTSISLTSLVTAVSLMIITSFIGG